MDPRVAAHFKLLTLDCIWSAVFVAGFGGALDGSVCHQMWSPKWQRSLLDVESLVAASVTACGASDGRSLQASNVDDSSTQRLLLVDHPVASVVVGCMRVSQFTFHATIIISAPKVCFLVKITHNTCILPTLKVSNSNYIFSR